MEGDAQLWFQLMKEETHFITQEAFKRGLHNRYGPTQFQDFFGDLTKLQHISSVRDYQTQFERLLIRAGRFSPAQQVGCFVSGLKDNIRTNVQVYCPSTLSAAIRLARLYEFHNLNNRRASNNEIRRLTFNTVTMPNQNYSQ